MHFWLQHTAHFAEKIVFVHLHAGSVSAERVGQRGWPQGAVHLAAARPGCEEFMVGTGWPNSCADCMNRLRKRYSHLSGGPFLVGKAAWALSGFLLTENAHAC